MNKYAQGGFEIISERLDGITDLADWFSAYLYVLLEWSDGQETEATYEG